MASKTREISTESFELVTEFEPSGDQPQAIEKLVQGVRDGLGASGGATLRRVQAAFPEQCGGVFRTMEVKWKSPSTRYCRHWWKQ